MMWRDSDVIMNLFEKSAKKNKGRAYTCPVCGENEAHIFFYRFEKSDIAGPGWVWCSYCKSFSHVRYLIPDWWENISDMNADMLCNTPENLDEQKSRIDEHVDKLLEGYR